MLAVLLALAAAVGYGGSDYSAGLAARRASVIRVTILAEATSVALLILVLPLAGLRSPSWIPLAWGAGGGIAGAMGALALYAGFRHAAFSVAASLSAVGSAGFSVLAGLLLGEHPGRLALVGIGLALPAIVSVSVSPGKPAQDAGTAGSPAPAAPPAPAAHGVAGGRHGAGVLWGLVAGACFAALFIALNRAGAGSGLWPVAAAQDGALLVVGCIAIVTRDLHLPATGSRWLAILTGVSGSTGTILYFLATHAGLLAITAVLTSLYPAVTILLARVFVGERLTILRLAGLCLAAASVGLIAAGGAR